MSLPIKPQPDCASAWRAAVAAVDLQPGDSAYNVLIDIADPLAGAGIGDSRVAVVNAFLQPYGKSVETVANTIFPSALYYRHGAPAFFSAFRDRVLPKVRKNARWSGYYFERMMQVPAVGGGMINQLWDIVERMKNPAVKANNKFELSLFDPERDVDDSPYGGQCLSFLSFKLLPGSPKTLTLTALYRNHFYVEKLLGNLIGLGRLMEFVAHEAGLKVGTLTILSTHAEIDKPMSKQMGQASRAQIDQMLAAFDQASAKPALAA
jgi:hypothetical protein